MKPTIRDFEISLSFTIMPSPRIHGTSLHLPCHPIKNNAHPDAESRPDKEDQEGTHPKVPMDGALFRPDWNWQPVLHVTGAAF